MIRSEQFWLGGLELLIEHLGGIFGLKILEVPMLQQASPASILAFAFPEYIFYWCIVIGIAVLFQKGWRLLRKISTPLLLAITLLTTLLAACGNGRPAPTPSAAPAVSTQTAAPPPGPTMPATTKTPAANCIPTIDDGLSPTYKPEAPIRSSVGRGHVLTGVVRSSRDCASIANAQLELWPEYLDRGHPDEARATIFTDSAGRYRFECDPPEHIHMRVSAQGYRTIAQNSYHPDGQAQGTFDIVLAPESP